MGVGRCLLATEHDDALWIVYCGGDQRRRRRGGIPGDDTEQKVAKFAKIENAWREPVDIEEWSGKGVSPQKCKAPEGPFRLLGAALCANIRETTIDLFLKVEGSESFHDRHGRKKVTKRS